MTKLEPFLKAAIDTKIQAINHLDAWLEELVKGMDPYQIAMDIYRIRLPKEIWEPVCQAWTKEGWQIEIKDVPCNLDQFEGYWISVSIPDEIVSQYISTNMSSVPLKKT